MGLVYLAHDKRLDRKVALKVLQLDPNLDEEDKQKTVNRFYIEGRSLAKLTHPNIVSIYDIGEEDGQYYMIMEFLEGKSLAKLLQIKSPFSVDLVISIGIQITNALAYIHERGILHRDIKPGNIILSESGIAKLTDFGLAKLTDTKYSLTQTGSLFGSLVYIPPEQALGSKNLDNRADIYSLGVTLYELVTGVSPFQDETIAVVIRKILEETPANPSSIIKSIPKELDEIILKAIKKSPDERYKNISEMEADLIKLKEKREKKNETISQEIIKEEETHVFSGKIEDSFLISTIIEFLSLNNNTGRLNFKLNNEIEASIYIFEGNITHAEVGNLTGLDAITHILCWKYARGEFSFSKDYNGEKLFYKSLGTMTVRQILDSANNRINSCLYRKYLHNKLHNLNKSISAIKEELPISENNIVKKKFIDKFSKRNNIKLHELISKTHSSEIDSCNSLFEMLQDGMLSNISNLDKEVPYSHLLHVVNIISKYTDKSIALKFVASKKNELNLNNPNNVVTIKQLYRLTNLAYKEFYSLLPDRKNKWIELREQIREYLSSLVFE